MEIQHFMNDGANWQAQAVLAMVRHNIENAVYKAYNEKQKDYDCFVKAARFYNCREQGYVISVTYNTKQKNYFFYEHRNSDDICVVMTDDYTLNPPTLADFCKKMKSSSDYDRSFSYGKIVECGNFILDNIMEFIEENKG